MDEKTLVVAGAKAALDRLWKMFAAQPAIDEASEELRQEILFEVQRHVDALALEVGQIQSRLAATEAVAFFAQYVAESLTSPTKERRQLLAAALAGTLRPDFDLELKSRIARVVARLEPSDVVLLRQLPDERLREAELELITGGARLSLDALINTGCATETVRGGFGGSGPFYDVTELGRRVREYLTHWSSES